MPARRRRRLIALGEWDRAATLVETLEIQGTALSRSLALATAARCRGALSAEQGDEQASMSSFALALEHHERVEQPFELGRTLLGLGIAQRRFKRKRLARESLTAASDTFDGLGAEIWSRRARDELSRISGRAGSTAGTLNETERRVAELVIQGRSNREVADALFVSVKTVEANLTRVYAKLGVSSRRELALAMSRGRPPRSRVAAAIARALHGPLGDPPAVRSLSFG